MPLKDDTKLTDKQIAQLYMGLSNDLKKLVQIRASKEMRGYDYYDVLYDKLKSDLDNPDSTLSKLDDYEKKKTIQILKCLINSHPMYKPKKSEPIKPESKIILINQSCYCDHNDHVFTWMILLSLQNNSVGSTGNCSVGDIDAQELLFLLLIMIAAALAFLALIALYYVLSQTVDNLERMLFNEGWLQAAVSMLSGIAGATFGGGVGVLAAIPLCSLAVAAGVLNPLGVLVLSIVCLSLIGAASAMFLTNVIQPYVLEHYHGDALDPTDPYRFMLTPAEEANLVKKNLNPIAIKCAMVAIRAEIKESEVPSKLTRFFTSKGRETQQLIDDLRKLRRGEVENIKVDDKQFDLRLSSEFESVEASNSPIEDNVFNAYTM